MLFWNSASDPRAAMTVLHETWLHFDAGTRTTLSNPIWLTFSLFQPVMWLVLFAPLLDNFSTAALPFPSLLAIATPAMFMLLAMSGSLLVGFGLIPEIRAGVLERISLNPAHHLAMVLGRALRDVFVLLMHSTLLLGIAWLVGLRADGADVVLAMGLVLAIGLLLALCANALVLLVIGEHRLAGALTFITLPLVLLSAITLPLMLAPGWIAAAAELNPLSYAIDVVSTFSGRGFAIDTALRGLVVAGALASLAVGWAVHTLRRVVA
jgi:ABC-2 type transport system permease protein